MIAKRASLKVHYYIAVAAALLFLLQASTGIAISWRWELAGMLDPSGMTGTPHSSAPDYGGFFKTAAAQLPEAASVRVFFPLSAEGVYFFQMETEEGVRYASVNPSDGQVLRHGTIWHFPVEAALKLHNQPLPGKTGNWLTLLTGCSLALMAISGLYYWWPRSGGWRSRLAVNPKLPMKMVIRQLHRTAGIVLMPLLLTIAITGMILAGELLAGDTAGDSDSPHYSPITTENIGAGLNLAKSTFPQAEIRDVRFSNGDPVIVQLWQTGTGRWTIHRVTINNTGDKVIDIRPAALNDALWAKFLPIHTGSLLGLGGRILAVLAASGLLLLTLMGVFLWFTKQRQHR